MTMGEAGRRMNKGIDQLSDAELRDELARREAARADATIVEAGERYAAKHPVVGRWRVTTEGDCEGRTTHDLGVHVGHVADIAAALAPLAQYALAFKPEPDPAKPEPNSAVVSVEVKMPDYLDHVHLHGAQRAAFVRPWLGKEQPKNVTVEVSAGSSYGAVKLRLTPREGR